MTQTLTQIVQVVTQSLNAAAGQSTLPLLVVGTYAGCCVALHVVTRGKEFLIAGLSSALFLIPFVHTA